jgi:hypothetical protein
VEEDQLQQALLVSVSVAPVVETGLWRILLLLVLVKG